MINPNTIHVLSNMDHVGLMILLDNSGYSDCCFKRSTFLGINPDGKFVYEVEYHDDMGTNNVKIEGHVFVGYDHERGAITADF